MGKPRRLPILGETVRSLGTLVQIITPPPIQPPDVFIFEDKSFELNIMNGDYMIERSVTLNNLYRNNFDEAVMEARRIATNPKWGIPKSGYRVEVVEVITQSRHQADQDRPEDGLFYDERCRRMTSCTVYGLPRLAEERRRVLWATDWPDDKPPLPSTECVWWNDSSP